MTSHWESRNGYTPPPRLQQLRARDQQQQQYQQQYQQQQQRQQQTPLQQQSLPATGADIPPSQDMPHARSPSFFSFRANRQPTDGRPSAPLSSQPVASTPQYLPPAASTPNAPAQSPSGLPPPVQQPGPYTPAPQQQQPHYITQATPPVQQAPPPANQLPQQLPPPSQQPPVQMQPQNQRPSLPQQSSSSLTNTSTAASAKPTPAPPQMPQHTKAPSQSASPPLHPEIRSVVQLTIAHAHKIYFSGPLVRRLERQGDGQKPNKDDGWTEIWAQLGGTTLSIWDMKEIQEASKQGREVPPSYINVTDAFVQVLGSVTVPATPTVPAKRYTNVLTLNTAGSNLLLFSCPSTQALLAWAASLRLASWEKSRLEEIYTAHLIRITLSARDVPTTLVQGKTEGWARVRIAGQTDWKRVFVVVLEGADSAGAGELGAAAGNGGAAGQPNTIKKKRMSNLFSRDHNAVTQLPPKPLISMYTSPKPKDRKKALLTIHSVSQAFGVYPERPELISKSTLIKVEGMFGDEELAASFRSREGWLLLMPELEEGASAGQGQAAEMLKWVVALHDAFELYGRPQAWTWDPRDAVSLMFGYPVGPQKESLFLDREIVESMDPRTDRTSVIRTEMKKLLVQHMRPAVQAVPQRSANEQDSTYESPPALPPVNLANNAPLPALPAAPSNNQLPSQGFGQPSPPPTQTSGFQLPPFSFNTNTNLSPQSNTNMPARDRALTPITEQSSIGTTERQRSMSKDASSTFAGASTSAQPRLSGPSSGPPGPPAPLASPTSPVHAPPSASPRGGGAPEPLATAALFAAGPISASPTPITPNSLAPNSAGLGATSFQAAPAPGGAGSGSGSGAVSVGGGAVAMYIASAAAAAAVPSPQGSSTNVTTHANSSPSTTPSITTTAIARSFPQVPSPPPSGGSGNASPGPLHSPPPAMMNRTSTMSTGPAAGTRTSTIETRSPPLPVSRASVDMHTRTPPASVPTSPLAAFAAAPRGLSPQMQAQVPTSMQGQAPGQTQGQAQVRPPIVPSQEIAWQNAVQQRQQQATRTRTQDSFASPGRSSWDVLPPAGGREQVQAGVSNQQQQQQQQQLAPNSPVSLANLPSLNYNGSSNDLSNEAGALYYMTNSSPATRLGPHQVPQNQHQEGMTMTESSDESAPEEEEDQDADATPEEEDDLEYSQLPYTSASGSGSNSRAAPNGPTFSGFDSTRMTAASSNSSSNMLPEAGPPPSSYAPLRTTSPGSFGPSPGPGPGQGPSGSGSPSRSVLGRKPSGARAQVMAPRSFSNNGHGAESISSQTVTESDETNPNPIMASTTTTAQPPHHRQQSTGSDVPFDDGEALAALTYLDIADEQELAAASGSGSGAGSGSQAHGKDMIGAPAQPARDRSIDDASVAATGSGESGIQYRSSFAPSSKATERKAKAQAQQAAQHAATHKPGRANGKRKSRVGGAWESSEEEEEEEEDDEEDDEEEDDSQGRMTRGSQSMSSSQGGSHAPNTARPSLQQLRQPGSDYTQEMSPSHLRPPRNLPQIPGVHGNDYPIQPIPRRPVPDQQYAERRTYYEEGTPIRTQAEYPQPGAARQTMWSQVLDPGHQPGRAPLPESNNNAKDTFVQLEPSETMTKAFTPQGLLSAGLADKEDRSARRQEELARENGASLINVPNKPPPPQTGLLGAITAHERDRKREGGVGAALTEREREKRVAEERQRRFDEQQRQQLEQMQQGGSMYGSQFGMMNPMMNPMMMGMNPMMGMSPMMSGNGMIPGAGGLSPMMTGGNMGQMNPMMTGQMGQMGYPGMMAFNPQHMFAAQQAAASAYQQAMMAFSVAGSQVGGNDARGGAGTPPGNASVNPAMAGMQGMGGMSGYDPRMSMMGMPMMGMGMNMGMGMGGPMGQQMQLSPGQMPLNMHMTGMSSFDPRSSPGIANGGSANDMGLQPPSQVQLSSRTSSPASRGSPLARGHQETADRGRSSTRPTSPPR